jgi:hypothetical protein
MRIHYDPEVDIALIVIEPGSAVSEEHEWGLIDRDPDADQKLRHKKPSNHPCRS